MYVESGDDDDNVLFCLHMQRKKTPCVCVSVIIVYEEDVCFLFTYFLDTSNF